MKLFAEGVVSLWPQASDNCVRVAKASPAHLSSGPFKSKLGADEGSIASGQGFSGPPHGLLSNFARRLEASSFEASNYEVGIGIRTEAASFLAWYRLPWGIHHPRYFPKAKSIVADALPKKGGAKFSIHFE